MSAPLHRLFSRLRPPESPGTGLYQPLGLLMVVLAGIHQVIRLFQEIIQAVPLDTVRVGTNAGLEFICFAGYFIIFIDPLFNAVHNLPGAAPYIFPRKGYQELVPTDPGRKFLLQIASDDAAQAVQRFIPLRT